MASEKHAYKKKKKIEFIIDLIAHFQANAEEENNVKYYNVLKLSSWQKIAWKESSNAS